MFFTKPKNRGNIRMKEKRLFTVTKAKHKGGGKMAVKIIHGANDGYFCVEGESIKQVLKSIRQAFNIPDWAIAFVNGSQVDYDHKLESGDILESVQKQGRKGGLQDYWSEAEVLRLFGPESLLLIKQNGFKPKSKLVFEADDVISWQKWLSDRSIDPKKSVPVQANIDGCTITVLGIEHSVDQQIAAVVQVLIDANGEVRSTRQMKEAYPEHILDDRLDLVIKRKLRNHPSGIWVFFSIDKKGYRMQRQPE